MADLSQFEHVFHPDGKLLVRIDDHWFFVDRTPHQRIENKV